MKTNELTGAALDWAVAKCEGYFDIDMAVIRNGEVSVHYFPSWNPSKDWAQGGPIIEREKIGLDYYPDGSHKDGGIWAALMSEGAIEACGPTLLITAMRCFVVAKLGNEIEIPPSLCS